jgi:hypothetical protein
VIGRQRWCGRGNLSIRSRALCQFSELTNLRWPAPGSEDTELGVLMELEVRHGEASVYA